MLLLLLPCTRVIGQAAPTAGEVITVRFGDEYALPEGSDRDSYAFLVPVPLRNDSATFSGTPYRIIYPAHMDPDSVAVASSDTGGEWDTPFYPSINYLIYPYQAARPTLYVDTALTLDFTATRRVDYVISDSAWTVKMTPDSRACPVFGRYGEANWASEEEKRKFAPIFARSTFWGGDPVPPEYWLRQQRLNFRYARFTYADTSYRIGLFDTYANGRFTDEDEGDRILFGRGEEPLSKALSDDGYLYAPDVLIGAGGQVFRVVNMDACGNSISLLPVDTLLPATVLRMGAQLAALDSAVTVDRSIDLRALRTDKEFMLLDFWGSWCTPCMEAMPELRGIHAKYGDRLQLIGMNNGDSDATITEVEAKHGMAWPSWSVTEEQAEQLGVDGYPTYLLLSGAGTLLLRTNRLEEVINLIETQ